MEFKLENKEICASCGGRCCKKCGCDYAPKDFESLSIDYLQSKLEEGNISIVCRLYFDMLKNGKLTCIPLLHLRARNINRPIVDLLSIRTQCKMLKEAGCPYSFEERPSGAKNIIPCPDFDCKSLEDPNELIAIPWERYQKILSRLVKRITGCSVDQKLAMDVEKLFKDLKEGNFESASKEALEEVLEMLPFLIELYGDEFKKVVGNINSNKQFEILLNKVNKI